MRKTRRNQEQRRRTADRVRKTLHSEMSKRRDEKAYQEFRTPAYGRTAKDHIIGSIKNVDMSDLRIAVIAVYESPEDYPGKYVARVFDVDMPTNVVMVRDTLEEIQGDIRKNTAKEFFRRGKEDVPCMIGAWI